MATRHDIDQFVMDLEDYIFLTFVANCPNIRKSLRDKRLKANRYVTERTTRFKGSDFTHYAGCWFQISYNKETSVPLDIWARECERMGLRWELRQTGDYHVTVFLLHSPEWLYHQQVRNRETDGELAVIRWNSDKGHFEKIQKAWEDPCKLIELGDTTPKKWPPAEVWPNYADKVVGSGRPRKKKKLNTYTQA
jgi:hypothetical protein